MKPKPGHIFCLLGMAFFFCLDAQAQEAYPMEGTGGERDASYSPVDGETGSHLRVTDAEPAEYADADTSGYSTPAASERPGSQSGRAEGESSAQSGNQDSVLGFNFLYYIIQKFKMSDIVDK